MNRGLPLAGLCLLTLSLLVGTGAVEAAQAAKSSAATPGGEGKVTVYLKETPFRTAIDSVFANSGLEYSIGPDVENTPVTLEVRNVSVAQAVRLIVRQVSVSQKGLTYEAKDGVYNFRRSPRPNAVDVFVPRRPSGGGAGSQASSSAAWVKIELQHISAANIGELLGAQVVKPSGATGVVRAAGTQIERTAWVVPEGIEGILAVTADNSLVVRGTPEGMRALTDLLSLIDVPQRQTTLVLNAGSLRVESTIGESDEVTLVDADGAERLEVKVSLQRTSGGLYANLDGLVRINGRTRSFKTRRTVMPGVAIPIATVDGGKGKVTLYMKATASGPTLGGFGGGGERRF